MADPKYQHQRTLVDRILRTAALIAETKQKLRAKQPEQPPKTQQSETVVG